MLRESIAANCPGIFSREERSNLMPAKPDPEMIHKTVSARRTYPLFMGGSTYICGISHQMVEIAISSHPF